MIKSCPNCNSVPSQNGYIKCVNDKCEEFNVEYLAHDWQSLVKDTESLCDQGSAACIQSLEFNYE